MLGLWKLGTHKDVLHNFSQPYYLCVSCVFSCHLLTVCWGMLYLCCSVTCRCVFVMQIRLAEVEQASLMSEQLSDKSSSPALPDDLSLDEHSSYQLFVRDSQVCLLTHIKTQFPDSNLLMSLSLVLHADHSLASVWGVLKHL